jgi:Holliday junction resolvase RusA-like endonuclease
MGQSRPYTDKVYKEWLGQCRALMGEWWTAPPLTHINCLICRFYGPARGDLDNRLGSVLDAGNGLIWKDDNVTVIGNIAMHWTHASPKEASIYMKIIWDEKP